LKTYGNALAQKICETRNDTKKDSGIAMTELTENGKSILMSQIKRE